MKRKQFIKAEKLPDGRIMANIEGDGGTALQLLAAQCSSVATIMLEAGVDKKKAAEEINRAACTGFSMAEKEFGGTTGKTNTETVTLGYTLPAERWQRAAETLTEATPYLAASLERFNGDGRGKEDAEDFAADMALACIALQFVAGNAADRCRFIPLSGGAKK